VFIQETARTVGVSDRSSRDSGRCDPYHPQTPQAHNVTSARCRLLVAGRWTETFAPLGGMDQEPFSEPTPNKNPAAIPNPKGASIQ
jgi:hypothetical protein